MKINGLQRVNTDVEKTRFEISIASFESKEERKKEKEKEFEVNVLSYRRITGYKIYDSSNNIIAEGMVPESDKWSTETLALSVLPKEKKIIVDNLIQKSAVITSYSIHYTKLYDKVTTTATLLCFLYLFLILSFMVANSAVGGSLYFRALPFL